MPWNLRRDFHIDINAAYGTYLLVSANDSALKQPPPDMISGDGMPVRFYFWERSATGALTAADPGSASTLIFSGRPAAAPAGSSILFLTTDFTQISPGVWEGTLNLATPEFAAHIAADPAGSKIILGELEVRNADNSARTSLQFDLTARPQVYANDATPLALPTPAEWLIGPGAPANTVATATATLGSGDSALAFTAVSPGADGNRIRVEIAGGSVDPLAITSDWGVDSMSGEPYLGVSIVPGITPASSVSVSYTVPIDGYIAAGSTWVVGGMLASLPEVNAMGSFANAVIVAGILVNHINETFLPNICSATQIDNVITITTVGRGSYANGLALTFQEGATNIIIPAFVLTAGGVDDHPTTAAELAAALNAIPGTAVTAVAGGDGSGYPAAGTITLSGGISPTAAPPYLRVSEDFLYVQQAGTWKKAALSDL